MALMRYPWQVIKCERCGCDVELADSLTNECEKCGALYNGFGQRLRDGVDDINHPFHDGKVF